MHLSGIEYMILFLIHSLKTILWSEGMNSGFIFQFLCLFVCLFFPVAALQRPRSCFFLCFFLLLFFFSMDLTRFFSKWEFCRSLAGPLMSFDSARNALKIGHRFAISQRTRTAFFFSYSFFLFLNARIFSRSIGRKIKKLATPPSAFHTPLLFSIYHFFSFLFVIFFLFERAM